MLRIISAVLSLLYPFLTEAQVVPFRYDRVGSFNEGLAPVYIGTKLGYIDTTGREVIPVMYEDDFRSDKFLNGLALVKMNNLYGLADRTGKLVVPCEYSFIDDFSEGLAAAYKPRGKMGFINTKGETVIPFQFNILSMLGGVKCVNGLVPVQESGNKIGFFSKGGKQVVPFLYASVKNFSEGLAVVSREWGGKTGFINTTGQMVIAEKYDNATSFYDGIAGVNIGATMNQYYQLSGGKWGLIDKKGKEITPVIYDNVENFKNGLAIVVQGKYPEAKKGVVSISGKMILPADYHSVTIFEDRIIASKASLSPYAVFDFTGKQLCDFRWYPEGTFGSMEDGLMVVHEIVNNKIGKRGVVDKNGVLKIPFKYDYIGEFSGGFAPVGINNKYGVIDKSGKEIIPLQYERVGWFREGWAEVMQQKKASFINKRGQFIGNRVNSGSAPGPGLQKSDEEWPSPEPYESDFQRALNAASTSTARAKALEVYLNAVYLQVDSVRFAALVKIKIREMAAIDFYAIHEMLMKNKGANQFKISKFLLSSFSPAQRSMIGKYSNCLIDNFTRRNNNQPELPCPPANTLQPGQPWRD